MVDRIGRWKRMKGKRGEKKRKKEISMLVMEPSRRIDLNSQRVEEKEKRTKKEERREYIYI